MLHQRDNLLWHKSNALVRHALVRGLGNFLADHVTVNEFPKSGGGWIAQMLADGLELPFPRNRLPHLSSSILHGHLMGKVGTRRHVVVWRDGRDVAVSWFYHFVVGNNFTSARIVSQSRAAAGISGTPDPRRHFAQALRHFLTQPTYPRYTWADYVDHWAPNPDAVFVRYEDMLAAPEQRLMALCGELDSAIGADRARAIVARYSFKAQTGRQPGEEQQKSYLRKGVSGDWRNHFDAECREMFERAAGAQLRMLGYERDDAWVRQDAGSPE